MELRAYQKECIDKIIQKPPGHYLVQMATGLGKTVTFANIPRDGRMLILSHREELVYQPLKYFPDDVSKGVEMAGNYSNGEDVVSASVMSIVRRLNNFRSNDFDMIIVDEAHHSAANTYRKILQHFSGARKVIGFTATPNRSDNVRLDDIYSEIIFQRDLVWAIKNGYLCDIHCLRVNIGYDLSAVHTRAGDYAPGELEKAMDGTADAIAQAYFENAVGQTVIFAVSVNHCHEIQKRIPDSVVVTGETKDRAEIIKRFTNREIPCLINCMVFTEGTDIPLIETVIIARPTQSDSLYTQMVGRGLRTYPGKKKLTLIDCVGITGKRDLCTAPSLLGIDMTDLPMSEKNKVSDIPLFDIPHRVDILSDNPVSWVKNVETVDLFAKSGGYDLHGVDWYRFPDGRMTVSVVEDGKNKTLTIPAPDALGMANGHTIQEWLDAWYEKLTSDYSDCAHIWKRSLVRRWSDRTPTEKQLNLIKKMLPHYDTTRLTKGDASKIITRLISASSEEKRRWRNIGIN